LEDRRKPSSSSYKWIEENRQGKICYAYLDDGIPALAVNAQGWQQFLQMLVVLRDKACWFYVTLPNGQKWEHLPFLLTTLPKGHSTFYAIECIRLEPESRIDLQVFFNEAWSNQRIMGNIAGLLLFSEWIRGFAESSDSSLDIQNPSENFSPKHSWICLRRVGEHSKEPLISFEMYQDSTDIYIYGNRAGFCEVADIIEIYAFRRDDNNFPPKSPKGRLTGDCIQGVLGPEGSYSLNGWEVVGGRGRFSTDTYCPSIQDLKNFINDRIILKTQDLTEIK